MTGGYSGRLVEIDLSKDKISETRMEENLYIRYVGGRGLGQNTLGDLRTSSFYLTAVDRLLQLHQNIFTGKFPQRNGIIGSTLSGGLPMALGCRLRRRHSFQKGKRTGIHFHPQRESRDLKRKILLR